MNRKRFIYFTDLILIPLFILSLYTGIKLHIAGHHANHEIWHNWTVFHTIASLLFTIFGIVHIKSHWGWYKGLKTTGCKGKKKVVLLFSITFCIGYYYRHTIATIRRWSQFANRTATLQNRYCNGSFSDSTHIKTKTLLV